MSTIYSDALGNRFVGNCRWGNHDINYPSTNWLKSVGYLTPASEFLTDMTNAMIAASYTSVSKYNSTLIHNVTPINTTLFTGVAPGKSHNFVFKHGAYFGAYPYLQVNSGTLNPPTKTNPSCFQMSSSIETAIDYTAAIGPNSLSFACWRTNSTYNGFQNIPFFYYAGYLQDVNTNFSYYTPSINNVVLLHFGRTNTVGFTTDLSTFSATEGVDNLHYIANAQKTLLTTGDAIYTIACHEGTPTPTGQWATDMYVFDNNATLGYPCIGRVPNMLLGVGTYTYLKPVTLITAPDAGSNLWLPVGLYAGKTLLMRCYAE